MSTTRRTLMLKLAPATLIGGSVAIGAQANAESPQPAVNTLKGSAAEGAESGSAPEFTLVGGDETQRIVSQVKDMAASAGIKPQTPSTAIKYSDAKVYTIDFGSETTTTVTFPISGSGYVELSNLTFVLDSKGQILEFTESVVTETDDALFAIAMYEGGELFHTETVNPQAYLDDQQVSARGVSPTACVAAVLGVSVVFAGVILTLCGGSCSVPYTPPTAVVCGACIGGIAVVGGASIPAVMGCLD